MKKPCPRCEILPNSPPPSGTLYIVPPIRESRAALKSYLESARIPFTLEQHGIFAMEYTPEHIHQFFDEYVSGVGHTEQEDTKTIILPSGTEPTIADFIKMEPLAALSAKIRGNWLVNILDNGTLTTHFHSIVRADAPECAFAYECLIRAKDASDRAISPAEMFSVARDADLLFFLDRACRISAIQAGARENITEPLFINFLPSTIYDPKYCLRSTFEAIGNTQLDPRNIIFEVVESEEVHDTDHLLKILEYYREKGFRVALDDMGAGYSSLNLLASLKPDFIKLDIDLIRNVDSDNYKATITGNLLDLALKLNVPTIAEGVETVAEWQWLKEHGATYLQGFLFGKPAPHPLAPVPPKI